MTTAKRPIERSAWYALPDDEVARRMGVTSDCGLKPDDVSQRLAEHGPNELPTEAPPSTWNVARGQLSNPMNIMLLIVGSVSLGIGQIATAIVFLALVVLTVLMGTNQELKARASVEALALLQVPKAKGAPWQRGGRN